jgi:hypothetical protein
MSELYFDVRGRDRSFVESPEAVLAAEGIRSLLSGKSETFTFEYACHSFKRTLPKALTYTL